MYLSQDTNLIFIVTFLHSQYYQSVSFPAYWSRLISLLGYFPCSSCCHSCMIYLHAQRTISDKVILSNKQPTLFYTLRLHQLVCIFQHGNDIITRTVARRKKQPSLWVAVGCKTLGLAIRDESFCYIVRFLLVFSCILYCCSSLNFPNISWGGEETRNRRREQGG